MKVYYNPRCRTCRDSLGILNEHKQSFTVIDYLKNPITKRDLKKIIKLLGVSAHDLIRTKDKIYKDLYADKELSENQCVDLLIKHPTLMQRPIIVKNNQAIIGRPAVKVLDLLNCKI